MNAATLWDRDIVRMPELLMGTYGKGSGAPWGSVQGSAASLGSFQREEPSIRVRLEPDAQSVIVESEVPPPAWLEQSIRELQDLVSLPPDWDSYAARMVPLRAAFSALVFLVENLRQQSSAPSFVPTPIGEIQLEWHMAGKDMELRFGDKGVVSAWIEEKEYDLGGGDAGMGSEWRTLFRKALREIETTER